MPSWNKDSWLTVLRSYEKKVRLIAWPPWSDSLKTPICIYSCKRSTSKWLLAVHGFQTQLFITSTSDSVYLRLRSNSAGALILAFNISLLYREPADCSSLKCVCVFMILYRWPFTPMNAVVLLFTKSRCNSGMSLALGVHSMIVLNRT